MKLVSIAVTLLLAAAGTATSCASGRSDAERAYSERKQTTNAPYSVIDASTGVTVNYEVNSSLQATTVTVKGESEFVEHVVTKVENDVLIITFNHEGNSRGFSGKGNSISVSAPASVPCFRLSSGAVINVNSPLTIRGNAELDMSSGGILNFNRPVSCADFTTDMSSGSAVNAIDVRASGKVKIGNSSGAVINAAVACGQLIVDVSSGAVAQLSGKAATGNINASSGAVVKCQKMTFDGKQDVRASSAAVVYAGKARQTGCNTSTSGTIVTAK